MTQSIIRELDRHIHRTSGEILIITDGYHRLCAVDAFA
jgi:hypothetical protein